jgi:hypothetical protein
LDSYFIVLVSFGNRIQIYLRLVNLRHVVKANYHYITVGLFGNNKAVIVAINVVDMLLLVRSLLFLLLNTWVR